MKRKQMVAYLPDILKPKRELQIITKTEQPEIDALTVGIERVHDNQFVTEADEYGISRWESMLSLEPLCGLEDRRRAVLIRLMERLPFTMRTLRHMLAKICGEEGFAAELFPNDYALRVDIDNEVRNEYETVRSMLYRVTPANLGLIVCIVCILPELEVTAHAAISPPIYITRLDWNLYYSTAVEAEVTAHTGSLPAYRRTIIGGDFN